MQKYLYQHIRNENGHIVATLAINSNFQIGGMFRNPQDKKIDRQKALKVAAIRADNGRLLTVPEAYITPYQFNKNRHRTNQPFMDLLAIPLVTVVKEAAMNLRERAERYFKQ